MGAYNFGRLYDHLIVEFFQLTLLSIFCLFNIAPQDKSITSILVVAIFDIVITAHLFTICKSNADCVIPPLILFFKLMMAIVFPSSYTAFKTGIDIMNIIRLIPKAMKERQITKQK